MAKTKEPGITKIEGAKGFHYRVQIRIKNGEHLSYKPFISYIMNPQKQLNVDKKHKKTATCIYNV